MIAVGVALGTVLALTASVSATHLDEACTAFVSAEGAEPAPSATVAIGETLEVHGWFPSGEDGDQAPPVSVSLEIEGMVQKLFADVARDEHDEILLSVEFEPGDEGQWRVTAWLEQTDCGGQADVTVVAAAATPTPPALPDAAAQHTGMPNGSRLSIVTAAAALLLGGAATFAGRRASA